LAAKPLVVVTGSAGFIGSALVTAFEADYAVVGLDVKRPRESRGAGFIECDFTREDSVRQAFEKMRAAHGDHIASVVHLAAWYDFTGEPSPLYRELTVEGTRRLLHALAASRVEQLVFSSTLLVMKPAEQEGQTITEASETQPAWDYPRSKLETEKLLRNEHGAIPLVILRIAGVYDDECRSIPIAQQIRRIYEKSFESYFFPGDTSHGQPFVHLDDLVVCIRNTIERRAQLPPQELLLIAEPDLMSYAELQDEIGQLIHGKQWPTIRIPAAAAKAGAWAKQKVAGGEEGFIKPWMVDLADDHYPVSIGRAHELLGWQPRRRLRDTLPFMIRALKKDPKRWHATNKLPYPEAERSEPRREAVERR
jgi:nucleoside-diphosphate-sugar epimerase